MVLDDHPNVLKSHCSFVSDHNLWVIMPCMAGGSCLHILKVAHPDGFEETVIATVLREVLKGLEYLHHHGFIYCDVKGIAKLQPFGRACCIYLGDEGSANIHPNLVNLHGCCIEGTELLLVYEYLENNSLARALFNSEKIQLILDWPTRVKICVGITKGLAYLHEESSLRIVHRDIKATNVLLDRDLNPKISDFGLARLTGDDNTHISTRVAGTIGYMAPEYALWGYLTYKADVYSFGIVLLEIVSGKNNNNYAPSDNFICLLDWACHLLQNGKIEELIDDKLGSHFSKAEAERTIKVALLCTSATPSLRPIMSEAVGMLEGKRDVPDDIPEASMYTDDLRFKALKDFQRERQINQSASSSQAQLASVQTASDLCEYSPESRSD